MRPTHVFLIDDDATLRAELSALLGGEGVLVETFVGVPAFIDWIDYDAMPSRACVLAALQLPEMNGLDLLNVLAADEISLPTVLMMAEVDLRMAVEAMRRGASYVVQKPVSTQLLLDTLELVVADRAEQKRQSHKGTIAESLTDIEQRMASLSPRQREILGYVFDGKLNKVIADQLGISIKTVELHRARMMEKMRAESVIDLIKMTAQCSTMLQAQSAQS